MRGFAARRPRQLCYRPQWRCTEKASACERNVESANWRPARRHRKAYSNEFDGDSDLESDDGGGEFGRIVVVVDNEDVLGDGAAVLPADTGCCRCRMCCGWYANDMHGSLVRCRTGILRCVAAAGKPLVEQRNSRTSGCVY